MEISIQDIQTKVNDAEMVLIGIGEEFESKYLIENTGVYENACDELKKNGLQDLYPYVNRFFMREREAGVLNALGKLHSLVKDKNYFVVSTCMSDDLFYAGFKKDRIVSPCGTFERMQCKTSGSCGLTETPQTFLEEIGKCCMRQKSWDGLEIPVCKSCGEKLSFNTIYAEKYDETGYLDQWSLYMKWLQGTVNRKLVLLELGVGLQFPSVIRWPFEKTTYYNKKAELIRVHKNLYQLTPEVKEQGFYIPQNAIDVLNLL